jgi:two-component system, OmpR family, sensor histidine kinase KdpD
VDEFPHTNVPGSDRSKRWEDVEVLLASGIDVLTTMNIQHLESLNDQVWQISGIHVRETIPDWVVQQADEVVMVDLTPRALLHRLERGVVYSKNKAERAMQNFFQESTLVALRELALRQTAHEVEHRLGNGEQQASRLGAHHRILIWVTADPKKAMVIRRAKRVSDFLGAECFAVAVQSTGDLSGLPQVERDAVEKHLNFARNLHIETRILNGDDVANGLDRIWGGAIRLRQIYLTRPRGRKWLPGISDNRVQKIISLGKDMHIVIVSDREVAKP